jgi:hypothetical protein
MTAALRCDTTAGVWTVAESGTEIELIIPAAHAYVASPRRSWFAEKFSGKSAQSNS